MRLRVRGGPESSSSEDKVAERISDSTWGISYLYKSQWKTVSCPGHQREYSESCFCRDAGLVIDLCSFGNTQQTFKAKIEKNIVFLRILPESQNKAQEFIGIEKIVSDTLGLDKCEQGQIHNV